MKKFAVVFSAGLALAIVGFVATICSALAWASRSHNQSVANKTRIMDYPKVFHGLEPIKITDMGNYNFQITNVSKQAITQFTLRFAIARPGVPLHGKDAHQHLLPVPWGEDGKQLLPAGSRVVVSIGHNIGIIEGDPDVDLNNTEIWAFDARFQDPTKMWRAGKFLTRQSATSGWQEDSSLNPAVPNVATSNCFQYDSVRDPAFNFCANLDCSDCKYAVPPLKRTSGGNPMITTCAFCMRGEVTCQKSNGFACSQPNVQDIDFSSSCDGF